MAERYKLLSTIKLIHANHTQNASFTALGAIGGLPNMLRASNPDATKEHGVDDSEPSVPRHEYFALIWHENSVARIVTRVRYERTVSYNRRTVLTIWARACEESGFLICLLRVHAVFSSALYYAVRMASTRPTSFYNAAHVAFVLGKVSARDLLTIVLAACQCYSSFVVH